MARENNIKMIEYAMNDDYVGFQKEVHEVLNQGIADYAKNFRNELISGMNGVEPKADEED